jgi:hypothetical protein
MSNNENDKIMAACYEDFVDLFHICIAFELSVRFLILLMEENGRPFIEGASIEDCIGELVCRCWEFDADLLLSSKRDCVEAYIMYIEHMRQLNEKAL